MPRTRHHRGIPQPAATNTHAAMGLPLVDIGTIPLFCGTKRIYWLTELNRDGIAGLLYMNVDDMVGNKTEASEAGFHEQYWADNGDKRDSLYSHLTSMPFAGAYHASRYLPVSSALSSIMCAVADVFPRKMVVSLPQLLVAGPGGFCPDYFRDEERGDNTYRCFMFLGGYIVSNVAEDGDMDELKNIVERRGFTYIISNAHAVTEFDTPFISLQPVYDEARHKYRMFPGDILVFKTTSAFCVELPIAGRMEDARMLSWVVRPQVEGLRFPVPVSQFSRVPLIEEVVENDVEAREMYEREIEDVSASKFQVIAKEGSDVRGNMERKRVTPNLYENYETVKEICFNICSQAFRGISNVAVVSMAPACSSVRSERFDDDSMDDDSVFGDLSPSPNMCDEYESEDM